jgi:hypothetical protein
VKWGDPKATPLVKLLSLMDYKVITVLGHNSIQIVEWHAVVTDVLAIIDLKELTILRWSSIVFAHVIEVTLIGTVNRRLGT